MWPGLTFQGSLAICILTWDWTSLQKLCKTKQNTSGSPILVHMLPVCNLRTGWVATIFLVRQWVQQWYGSAVHRTSCYWQQLCPWILGPWTGAFQGLLAPWSEAILKVGCLISNTEESLGCLMVFTALRKAETLPRIYKRTSPDLAHESALKVSDCITTWKTWKL